MGLKIVRYNSQEVSEKACVVFIVIFYLDRQFLKVGVGPRFYGFTLKRDRKEAVLCHNSPPRNKTKFLNTHRTG